MAIVYSESCNMLSYFIAVSFTLNETAFYVYYEIVTTEK